ncbi:EAL domain-containing protein [Arthrobacter sp. NA-172]|uniref:sensor domain-containing phosphodiesterase n=1 Tax=Arthrobacter sp. NA-172 TaxID=3367524 RepID=UPI003754036E
MWSSVGRGAGPDGALMRKLNGSGEKSARGRPKRVPRASADGVKRGLFSPAGLWLLVVVCADAAFALSIRLPLVFGHEPWAAFDGPVVVPALGAVLLVPVVLHAAWRLLRQQRDERARASDAAQLMDTVLSATREWLWAVGANGRFTFSSPASRELFGYEPSELLGRPWSLVVDVNDLTDARKRGPEAGQAGFVVPARHRDGSRVAVEVSGRPRLDDAGQESGFVGTGRAARIVAADEVRARVEGVLTERTLTTAFQPIRCLGTGAVIGAEALARFVTSPVRSPETWFADAASVGRGPDLEFLAMETALLAAAQLPAELYIAVNLSPAACLDSRLGEILRRCGVPAGRVVVEVTERSAVADYEPLAAALARLRHSGLRVAVDDAGAGFASMRHILQLRPELIKLDRTIIAGIDAEPGQRALGMAMVSFATGIGATLIAEGIETDTELSTVTELGMNVGQGYLLGRPSIRAEDWAQWHNWSPGDGRANVQGT